MIEDEQICVSFPGACWGAGGYLNGNRIVSVVYGITGEDSKINYIVFIKPYHEVECYEIM